LSLATRVLVPELMDDPKLDQAEHNRALAGLRRINLICNIGKRIATEILRLMQDRGLQTARVLDVGCGSGDVAIDVWRRISLHHSATVCGWDMSPTAIASARKLAARVDRNPSTDSSISFEESNVFALGPPGEHQRFDFVYCSLFMHHFSSQQTVEILSFMKALATHGVLVSDLVRSRFGWVLAKIGCHLLSRSYVVHFDGPQSVKAAYTTDEFQGLSNRAGMNGSVVRKHWPARFLFVWEQPQC
jgi:2-polyprenyl-3-methyl-5-hydroxy-6-metoxy-1,4-benzoquinol methylase